MMIHDITKDAGKFKKKKRLGRGPGSGTGKTAGRGAKGAGSRSGWTGSIRASREGGQMPLFRRLPKRGFNNYNFRTEYAPINLKALEARFEDGAEINPEMLMKAGLISDIKRPIKILAEGELTKKFNVSAAAFSKIAAEKIVNAGGTTTVIG